MDKACVMCARPACHRHHIIGGRGKRTIHETEYSVIPLCADCHYRAHHTELGWLMKLALQRKYFEEGYNQDAVRQLMGGKLYLEGGEVYGTIRGDPEHDSAAGRIYQVLALSWSKKS